MNPLTGRRNIHDDANEILEILDRPDPKAPVRNAAQALRQARDAGECGLRYEHLRQAQQHMKQIDPRRYGRELQQLQGEVLALQGRGGDTQIAHVTPHELVIPLAMQTPAFMQAVAQHARRAGVDPRTFTVGSRHAKVNPRTGHQEFDSRDGESSWGERGLSFPRDDTFGHGYHDDIYGSSGDEGQSSYLSTTTDEQGNPIETVTVTARAPKLQITPPDLEYGLQATTCDPSVMPDFIFTPPDASVGANMQEASQHPENLQWFYNQVHNKAPWDYKQRSSQYQQFGNFNYGATGAAAGIPDQVLLRAAGWAQQRAGTSQPAFGHWWGNSPYGDDPDDQDMIQKGIAYAKNCR